MMRLGQKIFEDLHSHTTETPTESTLAPCVAHRQRTSPQNFAKTVWTALTCGLLASAPAAAAAPWRLRGASSAALPNPLLAAAGRRALACAPTPVSVAGRGMVPSAQDFPAFAAPLLTNFCWAMFQIDTCNDWQILDHPLSLSYTTRDEALQLRLNGLKNLRPLSAARATQVEQALAEVQRWTNARFSAGLTAAKSNLIFRAADATDGSAVPAIWADPPASLAGNDQVTMHTLVNFVGPADDLDFGKVLQAVGSALGLATPPHGGVTGETLASTGPFGRHGLATRMAGAANACYAPTTFGALDLQDLVFLYGQHAGLETVKLAPGASPTRGGLHLLNTTTLAVAPGFNNVQVALTTDGTLVSHLDEDVYLLSPASKVGGVDIAGFAGATVIGRPGAVHSLKGSNGNDIIDPNGATANITSRLGQDIVVIHRDAAPLYIVDFDAGKDRLGLTYTPASDQQPFVEEPDAVDWTTVRFPPDKLVYLPKVAAHFNLSSIILHEFSYLASASCYSGQALVAGNKVRRGFQPHAFAPAVKPAAAPAPDLSPTAPPKPRPKALPSSPPAPLTLANVSPPPVAADALPTGPKSVATGTIAGAAGGIVGGCLIIGGVAFWRFRRKDSQPACASPPAAVLRPAHQSGLPLPPPVDGPFAPKFAPVR